MIIPGYSKYDITEDGIVTYANTGKLVNTSISMCRGTHKYRRVCLRGDDGTTRMYNIMRLLAETYLPKPSEYSVAAAKDGDNLNTVVSNVIWMSRSQLAKVHAVVGRRQSKCRTADSIEYVLTMLDEYSEPITMSQLSCDLGLPYSYVRYSIAALVKARKVRKTDKGYEVIL